MGQSSHILKRTMRLHLLVLSALVAVGLVNEDVFLKWAKEQGKQYKTKAELTMRQAIFMKNYNRMVEHNKDFDAGKVTWARGVNQWYDLTMEEWRAEMGIGMSGNMEEQNTTSSTPHPKPTGSAPSSWDWRSHGIVSPVKNQKHCGSCAAFTTVAIVESCFAQQTGVITDLSEEHLVNCMATNGCSGWYTNQYLDDLVSSNGGRLEQEYCCSYTATDGHCSDDNSCDYTSASVTGHYISWYAKETEMAAHVAATGPAGTTIFADYLFDYSYGIFEDPRCCEETTDPNCRKEHNHAVTAVGYGSEGGRDFWIVKNSWGPSWGESGFFRIKRGTGHCGFGIYNYVTPYCS